MTPENILSAYEEKIKTTGLKLRAFLLAELRGVAEEADTSANIISFNYGKGYKNIICVIIPSKQGIKLGFYKGSELPDPGKLLTGSGKVHRFVEIKSPEDIYKPGLKNLLKAALAAHAGRQKK
jgi:hypothetical protein